MVVPVESWESGGRGGEGVGSGRSRVGEEGVGGADVVAVGVHLFEAEEEGLLLDSLTLRHAIIKITQNIFDNATGDHFRTMMFDSPSPHLASYSRIHRSGEATSSNLSLRD
jgi:hypothetical protein